MVIFDASTLILLTRAGVLDVFLDDYQGEILIPEKVRSEILQEGREGATFLAARLEKKKIKVIKVKSAALVKKLAGDFSLDAGEAEALVAALEKKADAVATDDRNAIRACKALRMEFVTAISIVIRAVEKGLVEKNEGLVILGRLATIGRYRREIMDDAVKRIEGGK